MIKIDKDFLLKDSKVFCMFPWIHLNATPKGDIYPCCSNDYTQPFGNTRETSLEEAFNSDKMKELRLNMLSEKSSSVCDFCYKHEQSGPYSFRHYSKEKFAQHFDDIIPQTEDDGYVRDFKMRYFDIRFSNICNFKCRTCGDEFSSLWSAESKQQRDQDAQQVIKVLSHDDLSVIKRADAGPRSGQLLEEVLKHIDHMDIAYFVGGEPLIMQEHYIMLEEMIRRGRTDIVLRYNTNASNIKFKNYDLLELWKHFKKVEVSCSIDHYGERAEWMRHGTDWGKIENNLHMFRSLDYVDFQINTVFSIFNYYTITEFFEYMISKNLIRPNDYHNSLYLALNPQLYTAKSMPIAMKKEAERKVQIFTEKYPAIAKHNKLAEAVSFARSDNYWPIVKSEFISRTRHFDRIRNEDFYKVFPEFENIEDVVE